MLPSSLRFPLRSEPEFFEQARRSRFPHLLVFYRTEPLASSTRFSVIIKKSHGNAVERAKFKRMVRAAIIALQTPQPHLFTLPYSVVLMPLGKVQSQAVYEQELTQFLESTAARAH